MGGNIFVDLVKAIDERDCSRWKDLSIIEEERREIMHAINAGTIKDVYGFTTLLGPLDYIHTDEDVQKIALEAHLYGVPEALEDRHAAWITVTKLEHLYHCGSGISPITYKKILEAFSEQKPIFIDCDASYSSADVVPASWWIKSIMDEDFKFPKGDVIALMNGSFISLGTIAYNIERVLLIIERLLCNIPDDGYYSFYKSEAQWKILESLSVKKLKKASPPQLSVLHRDLYPLMDLLFKTVLNAVQTLDSAFDRRSCNPLFWKENEEINAYSNSSFLDFTTTQMIFSVEYTISVMARVAYSFIREYCNLKQQSLNNIEKQAWVQPPKIALGYCIGIESMDSGLGQTVGSESNGVEDFWDTGLIHANNLMRQIDKLDKTVGLLEKIKNNPNRTLTKRNETYERISGLIDISEKWVNAEPKKPVY